jgi:hypothetical protein
LQVDLTQQQASPIVPVVIRSNQRTHARRLKHYSLAIAFVLPFLAGLGLALAAAPNSETPSECDGYLFQADFAYGPDAGLATRQAAAKDALLASYSVSVSDQQFGQSSSSPDELTVNGQDLPPGGPVHVLTEEVARGYVVEALWQCQEVRK